MQALVYTSRATLPVTDRAIDRILRDARVNNPALGLTGMLLWSERSFAQLLEGPISGLDEMLRRLVADKRHENVRVLSRWEAEARLFRDWSMASNRLDRHAPWPLLDREDGESRGRLCGDILELMARVRINAARAAESAR